MRIRQIKPEFWKHEGLAEVSRDARLLFIGLWQLADCEGRLDDRPKRIKAELFPYEDMTVDAMASWLDELASHPDRFITRYEVDGEQFIQIEKFTAHQKLQGNESNGKSNRPCPPAVTEKPSVTISSDLKLPSNSQTDKRRSTEILNNGDTDKRGTEFSCRRTKCTDEQKATADFMFQKILTFAPTYKPPNLESWGNEIRLMIEQDGRSLESIKDLFSWVVTDTFWRQNVLSPAKLREKWDQLVIKRNTDRSPPSSQIIERNKRIVSHTEHQGGTLQWKPS